MSYIWELEKGVKVNIIFDANCHLVGKEGCTLTRFLGTVARKSDVTPISYKEWRDIPQIYKDDVEDYRVDEMYEKINDPLVDKEQFEVLVEYWLSEKGEKISKQNKENRQKLEEPHCLGTKTFAQFANKEESFANGRKPSRVELYIQSRTKKDGGPVSEKASQVMEQLKNYISESTSTSALEETTFRRDDTVTKVKGFDKKGRVHCLGKVPTSKKSVPSTSTDSNVEQRLSEVESKLKGLMQLIKARFPDENITVILQAANQLASTNRLDREVNFFCSTI
ncbi:hypothetical protein SLE2022_382930 [Rubroshorea leprosula]